VADPKSRREFLSGAGAVLALPRGAVVELLSADAVLLASLSPEDRELVQNLLDDYAAMPLTKCVAMLQAAGM
jgi:hypothetical protein